MVNKVIIISQAPLTPQIRRNTYILEYSNAGYDVMFWDVSQLMHPGIEICDQIEMDLVKKFNNTNDLSSEVQKLNGSKAVFIIDFDPSWNSNDIFNILKTSKIPCIRVDMYANTSLHQTFFSKLVTVFTKGGVKAVKTKIKNISYLIWSRLQSPFNFYKVLSSSKFSYKTDYINHPDYDEYLAINDCSYKIDEPYILFIDTFFGKHPDLKYYYGIKHSIDSQAYYDSLNMFFDFLEKKYNMPVIIAAHPKAIYDERTFNQRKIIKYSTLPLIIGAKYIIAQVCNTFSWITLANKPVALVSTNGYIKVPHIKQALKKLAKQFALPIYNIDGYDLDSINFKHIGFKERNDYIFSYLTSNKTKDKNNFEILRTIIDNIK